MSDAISLLPGDVLRIERRFIIDGVLSTSTSEGRFAGVECLGTAEHIALENDGQDMRLIPMSGISEITLVRAVPRAKPIAVAAAWDPSIA